MNKYERNLSIWTNHNIKYSINCISKSRELRKVSMTTDTKKKMALKLN